MFWLVLVSVIIGIVGISWIRENTVGTELSFGELMSGLESGRIPAETVRDLRITPQYIFFKGRADLAEIGDDRLLNARSEAAVDEAPASDPAEAVETSESLQSYFVSRGGISDQSISKLEALLAKKGVDVRGGGPQTDPATVVTLLVTAVAVVVFIIFLRRIGGAGTAMSFSRSRGRLYAEDDTRVTFEDVAGIDDAVEELREIVEFLRTPGKYQALGGRIPRGLLLVGPPGTGKTLLAKAVAGEAGVPFFSLSGSDFVELYVGVGAARVRDMFAQATQRAPSIIFIDEFDALGKTRGSGAPGNHDERDQTLNALLVEMDGFSSDQSVIVMGATNRPETLDPALLRPGRFDRQVLVDRPDYKGREAILEVHAKRIKMDDDVSLPRLARLTPGFVGADLANLVNEAALLAARRGRPAATMADFEEGIERVIAGLEKTSRIIREDEKRWAAYHECGHALVACSLPNADPVHKISIIPRGFALGYVLQRPEDDRFLETQSELQSRIAVCLGGIAAEELIYGETSAGARNDLEQATEIARRMVMDFGMSPKLGRVNYRESKRSPFLRGGVHSSADYLHSEQTLREIDLEVRRLIDESMQAAREILSTRRDALEHMARELIEKEAMSAEELQDILDKYRTGPQLVPGTSFNRTPLVALEATREQRMSSDLPADKAVGQE